MGVRIALFFLLVTCAFGQPIQERMKTWRLRIRHPDPRYLSTREELYKADSVPRVIQGYPIEGRGRWRPDPSAQVDEIKADLVDAARAVDP